MGQLKNFFVVVFGFISLHSFSQHAEIVTLDNWMFRSLHSLDYNKAVVPGVVHLDLLNNGIIQDPFLCNNENKYQWISDSTWEYVSHFNVTEKIFKSQDIRLIFEGIDTYSKVYLNDSLILESNNMFIPWVCNVKSIIKKENNLLKVILYPVDTVLPNFPGGNRVFHRKAQYQFGWDWGPVFKTQGIWKPVYIKAQDNIYIEDAFFEQNFRSDSSVEIQLSGKISGMGVLKNASITVRDAKTQQVYVDNLIKDRVFSLKYIIKNPHLWWCNGMGKPNLYSFKIELFNEDILVESQIKTIGLRKIELIRQNDSIGQSFYFQLNGVPVFAKGANWVPAESFLPRLSSIKYEERIRDAVESNFNMLRVWGGGIYEDDYFYELCDKNGILIWQDFMFACGMYPWTPSFLENVSCEAEYQIKRLRNHPCLALWCGNNEIDEGWHNWGWQKQFSLSTQDSLAMWNGYKQVFHQILPDSVKKLSLQTSYHASSPTYGWGRKQSLTHGDQHYWGVWWGMEPYEKYIEKTGRFASEYGFQAYPDLKTIVAFGNRSDSTCLKNHQKHPTGFDAINEYMKRDYNIPKNFEDYVYVSQLLQADVVCTAIESHRRAMPKCMGSLYWQFNDCWPVVSWSGIDYFGKWKALQYKVKELFKPVITSSIYKNDTLFIYGINDGNSEIKGFLLYTLMNFSGEKFINDSIPVFLPPLSSRLLHAIAIKKYADKLVFSTLRYKNETFNEISYFTLPKDLKLERTEPKISIISQNDEMFIIIQSKYLLKNVYLFTDDDNITFSNNYFDVLPNIPIQLKLKTELPESEVLKRIKSRMLNVN